MSACAVCDSPIATREQAVVFTSNEVDAQVAVHRTHQAVKLSEIRKALAIAAGTYLPPNAFDRTYRLHPDGEEHRAVKFLTEHVPGGHQVKVLVGRAGLLEIDCRSCEITYDTAIDPVGGAS